MRRLPSWMRRGLRWCAIALRESAHGLAQAVPRAGRGAAASQRPFVQTQPPLRARSPARSGRSDAWAPCRARRRPSAANGCRDVRDAEAIQEALALGRLDDDLAGPAAAVLPRHAGVFGRRDDAQGTSIAGRTRSSPRALPRASRLDGPSDGPPTSKKDGLLRRPRRKQPHSRQIRRGPRRHAECNAPSRTPTGPRPTENETPP